MKHQAKKEQFVHIAANFELKFGETVSMVQRRERILRELAYSKQRQQFFQNNQQRMIPQQARPSIAPSSRQSQ